MSTLTSTRRDLRAMATDVVLQVEGGGPGATAALDAAEAVLREVERTCSRFDPLSDLSRVNAAPDEWHDVPAVLTDAVRAAHAAHLATGGLFDPRVIGALEALGYDRGLPFADGVALPARRAPEVPAGPWEPRVRGSLLHPGGARLDLGGIAKGLAVAGAAAALTAAGRAVLVDAGGDCWLGGDGPHGEGWRVGVEDPGDPTGDPLLVLALSDRACATSSTRLRRWTAGGAAAHHLVDPRTGESARTGLTAVTVVHDDPATAEVWSKALLLGSRPWESALPAAWVTDDGAFGTTPALEAYVLWRSGRA